MAKESLKVFKDERSEAGENLVLSTGVRARLRPVAPRLLDDVAYKIKDPDPPMWHNEAADRDEPNPFDSVYNRELAETQRARGLAQLDVLIVCGVELLDGIPDVKSWLPPLKMLERLTKQPFLDGFDLNDELDREYVYKKYVAVGNADLVNLTKLAGLTPAEVDQAVKAFSGDKERGAD